MTVFWTMFWLGFLGVPLALLLAMLFKDDGSSSVTSHIWVYKGTNRKAKNATVKDLWKNQNPGKSWDKHQSNVYVGASIVLCIGLIWFLAWLSDSVLPLPVDRLGLRLFWQIGAPILGGLTGLIFFGIQAMIGEYNSVFLRLVHVVLLGLTVLGVIGALVFTFLERPLPFSQFWFWLPIGLMVLLLILDPALKNAREGRADKGGGNFEVWVYDVMKMTNQFDMKQLGLIMQLATYQLQAEILDIHVRDHDFFKRTESILLGLIGGKPLSIENHDIYNARREVIQTMQTFYFYSAEKFYGFDIHPKIQKAISKN